LREAPSQEQQIRLGIALLSLTKALQCHDLRVKDIIAIERASDCRKPFDLRADFNRHAVTLTEIAIKLVQRTWPPFLKASAIVARFQKGDCAYKCASRVARHAVSALVTKAETSSNE
jgi:hypothetical protein